MSESLLTINTLSALVTLTGLEIILGIDNLIYLTLLVNKLPKQQQKKARLIGLALAGGTRLIFLFFITKLITFNAVLFIICNTAISIKSVILIVGGLFLMIKATKEIRQQRHEVYQSKPITVKKESMNTFFSIIVQIAVFDIIFSVDSVITAIGLAHNLIIMAIAIIFSVFIMIFSAKFVSDFIEKNPSLKILALSFLILIGMSLLSEGLSAPINKGYIYFSMLFSVFVDLINRKSTNNQ